MKSTSKNGAPAGANGLRGAGARDESSVLFSLGALMAKENEEAPYAGRRDESGLIDIKALAAAAAKDPSQAKAARPPAVHVDIFPFEAPLPPPPAIEAAPVDAIDALPALKTSRRGVLVAGALLIGAAAAALGVALSSSGAPPVAAADPLGGVAETARQGTNALPPPAAAPSPKEAKSPAPTPQQNPSRPEPRRTTSTTSPTPTTPQPTPTARKVEAKPPATDACGGDLMCAMRRAAEKR